ncbi:sulfurtransferase [Vallicoccus soli]|uniref:sulfurtransferase n=1 Tax=Vallicoccus soli TaxID=2339232 RepID=UPI001C498325|nr:sulfurtransferase [Vallicoccus soli]
MPAPASPAAPDAAPPDPRLPPVVDADWLHAHRGEVVLADVRWYLDGRSGRTAYREGHLPGAVHVDLDRVLAAPPSADGGRHPLPDPAAFAEGLGALGVGDGQAVVAYDDAGGTVAARLVWLLRALGEPAALLDGGLAAGSAEAGALETADVRLPPAPRTPRPWPGALLADADDAADPAHVVLDARDAARYRGEVEPVDPRPGHVPGAVSLPARGALGPDGRFLPPAALRERFAAAGADGGRPVVAYCGSGVTACHVLLAMEHAGLGRGRLYPGSWSAWSASGRPAATGA